MNDEYFCPVHVVGHDESLHAREVIDHKDTVALGDVILTVEVDLST